MQLYSSLRFRDNGWKVTGEATDGLIFEIQVLQSLGYNTRKLFSKACERIKQNIDVKNAMALETGPNETTGPIAAIFGEFMSDSNAYADGHNISTNYGDFQYFCNSVQGIRSNLKDEL